MKTFEEMLQNQTNVKVIDATINYKDYVAFDLSAKHTDQINLDLTNSEQLEEFVENHLEGKIRRTIGEKRRENCGTWKAAN